MRLCWCKTCHLRFCAAGMEYAGYYPVLIRVPQCANYRTLGRCNPGCIASVSISAVSLAPLAAGTQLLKRGPLGNHKDFVGRRSPGTGTVVDMDGLSCIPLLFRYSEYLSRLPLPHRELRKKAVIMWSSYRCIRWVLGSVHRLSRHPLCRSRVFEPVWP